MTTLIAFMPAAFVGLAGLGIGASRFSKQESEVEQRTELTQDVVSACTDVCSQVAVLNGIDSAEALCGAYGVEEPFYATYTYRKCVKPEAVEGVTAEATKIIGDTTEEIVERWETQEPQCSGSARDIVDMIHSRGKEHGPDLTPFLVAFKCIHSVPSVDFRFVTGGRGFGRALRDLTRFVKMTSDSWKS